MPLEALNQGGVMSEQSVSLAVSFGHVVRDKVGGRRTSLHVAWLPAAVVIIAAGLTTLGYAIAHRDRAYAPSSPVAAGLQGGASGPLGGYSAHLVAGGFRAANPAQGLSTFFGPSGVTVGAGALRVNVNLRAAGYGAVLLPAGHANPTARANRITYRRSRLSEWYANGPGGLEQGFTIARAPAAGAHGPLTLSLAISPNAHLALARGRQAVLLSGAGELLSYSGLRVVDARGTALHSWFAVHGHHLLLRASVRGAVFPVRVDPQFRQLGSKITPSIFPMSGNASFGYSVAVDDKGETALVGGPTDGSGTGAVWVFTLAGDSTTWIEQQKIPGLGGEFGKALAISGDGQHALIGAPAAAGGLGEATLYERSGDEFVHRHQLSAPAGAKSFGRSVALSDDGEWAIVGAPTGNVEENKANEIYREGRAYTFLNGAADEELAPATKVAEEFGSGVALDRSGDIALVGAQAGEKHVDDSALAYTRSGTTWSQLGSPLASGCEYSENGDPVALSGDGQTALVGSPLAESGGSEEGYPGCVTESTFAGGQFNFTRLLEDPFENPEALEFLYGSSVAISGNGQVKLVGSPEEGPCPGCGLDEKHGQVWEVQNYPDEYLQPTDDVGYAQFGNSVAVSEDGKTALFGGPGDNAVWFYNKRNGVDTASQGTASGRVELLVPDELTVSSFSAAPATDRVPPTFSTPVGELSFRLEGVTPGATIDVTVVVPKGVSPSSVFKCAPTCSKYNNATINGNEVTLELTDNGAGDTDPALGVIEDPVIPAVGSPPVAVCTGDSGTLKLSPGLTGAAAVQTVKIKGALSGCSGEGFTSASYSATLKTTGAVSCSVLTEAGEGASGAAKFKWTPKAKPSTGTLTLPLTETTSVALSGGLASGTYSPLSLDGTLSESYEGGDKCGVAEGKKKAKAVKKGTFEGSAVSFD